VLSVSRHQPLMVLRRRMGIRCPDPSRPWLPQILKKKWTHSLASFIHVHRTALNFSDDGIFVAKSQHAYPNNRPTLLVGITSGPTYASAQHPQSTYKFPPEQTVGSSSPPQFTSPFSEETTPTMWSPTPKIYSSGSAVLRRRATSTGLGSLGRSSRSLGRSNSIL
jgi:hypothetical protein